MNNISMGFSPELLIIGYILKTMYIGIQAKRNCETCTFFHHQNPLYMPFIKVYIHFVWSTKDRMPLRNSPDLRKTVWQHMKENSIKKGIFMDTINGHQEHCHCLISLGNNQTISNIMQLLKGESSFWINKNKLCQGKFEWQDEYFAVSVSETDIETVRAYIRSQEQHHSHTSFKLEFDELMKTSGFQRFKDGSMDKVGNGSDN